MKNSVAYCKIRDSLNQLDRKPYSEIFSDIAKVLSQVDPDASKAEDDKKKQETVMTRSDVLGENRQEKTGKNR